MSFPDPEELHRPATGTEKVVVGVISLLVALPCGLSAAVGFLALIVDAFGLGASKSSASELVTFGGISLGATAIFLLLGISGVRML